MSHSKKGVRTIVVDGAEYHWYIRRKPTYSQGLVWSGLTFAVEHATHKGSVLVVILPQPHPSNWIGHESFPILPSAVARYIQAALHSGWKPMQIGNPFVMKAEALPQFLETHE